MSDHMREKTKIKEKMELNQIDELKTERPETPSRSSPLMLGKGKLLRGNNHGDSLELHLNDNDYSNLIIQQSGPRDSFDIVNSAPLEMKDEAKISSPRNTEVALPKTYLTRSGTLMLFSDRKIMKDNRECFPEFGSQNMEFKIQGHGLSPIPIFQRNDPKWRKLVNSRQTSDISKQADLTVKEKRKLLCADYKANAHKLYCWNYSMFPLELNNIDNNYPPQNLSTFSQAVLAYKGRVPSDTDKYLEMIKQTWHRKSEEQQVTFMAEKLTKLSQWTHEWIHSQRSIIMETEPIIVKRPNTFRYRKIMYKDSVHSRVPTNTPLPDSKLELRKVTQEEQRAMSSQTYRMSKTTAFDGVGKQT